MINSIFFSRFPVSDTPSNRRSEGKGDAGLGSGRRKIHAPKHFVYITLQGLTQQLEPGGGGGVSHI